MNQDLDSERRVTALEPNTPLSTPITSVASCATKSNLPNHSATAANKTAVRNSSDRAKIESKKAEWSAALMMASLALLAVSIESCRLDSDEAMDSDILLIASATALAVSIAAKPSLLESFGNSVVGVMVSIGQSFSKLNPNSSAQVTA
jgi:hypothetical protein